MLARAIVRRRSGLRGLGMFSIFTPGACGLTDLGVLKPECWALTLGPGIVGQSTYTAAATIGNEDVAYPGQPLPAVPSAVTNYGVSPTVPPTVDQAQAAVDAAIADAKARTNAQNINYFSQVAGNLDQLAAGKTPTSGGVNWWLVGGLGLLGLVLFKRL